MARLGRTLLAIMVVAMLVACGESRDMRTPTIVDTPTALPIDTPGIVLLPTHTPVSTSTPLPPAELGAISFSTSLAPSGQLGQPGLIFPVGTERVYGGVPFRNMRPGARLEERWIRAETLWMSQSTLWSERTSSSSGDLIIDSRSRDMLLMAGQYRVELRVDGELATIGYFVVLAPATNTPSPTPTHTWTPTPSETPTDVPTETPTHTPTPTLTPTPDRAARLERAYGAACYLLVPRDIGGAPSVGSGVLIDPRGLVLTSFHLVADPWTKLPLNAAGRVEIGLSADGVDAAVRIQYVAELIIADEELDLALLHIKTNVQGQPVSLADLPFVPLGDDARLPAAPDVHTCGYPSGAQTAVVLHGVYTGHSGDRRWIEVAAPFFDGYAGGMALNDDAELVGIINSYRQSELDPRTSRYYLRPSAMLRDIVGKGLHYLRYGALPPTPTPPPPADAPLAVVTAPDGLSIRKGPGMNAEAIWNAPRGTVVLLSTRRQADGSGSVWREVWIKDHPLRGWAAEVYLQELSPQSLLPPASGDIIAFQSDRSGNHEIYAMRSDGSEQRNLTNNGNSDTAPSWSPDRNQLAFVSNRAGNSDIYAMRYDGADVRRLTFGPAQELHPAWSPDGQRIAFVSNVDGDWEIWVVTADGGSMRQLTHNAAWDSYPSWAPDSRRLVFTSRRDGDYELYMLDVETGVETRLTSNPASDAFGVWSPAGSQIAFLSARTGPLDIYFLDVDQLEAPPVRLPVAASGLEINRYLAWAPNGQTLLFSSWRDGNAEVYAINRDGSGLRNLTGTRGEDESPAWAQ
jgi:hypothetical protein